MTADWLSEMEERLACWHDRKYGRRGASPAPTYRHLLEEVGELGEAIMVEACVPDDQVLPAAWESKILEESADVVMIFINLTRSMYGPNALREAINRKAAVIEDRLGSSSQKQLMTNGDFPESYCQVQA